MEEVYNEYYYKIYNYLLKKTNNKEDAEDLTNSVFLTIFEYFNRNIKIEKIENLIWKIAYNLWCTKAKEYINEKNNTGVLLEDFVGYTDNVIDKIIYREIVNDLDKFNLTEKEMKSFRLFYIEDLSIKDISTRLSTKEGNIKYYLYSARNKIKERYNE